MTATTLLGITLPTVGADADSWGGLQNTNRSAIYDNLQAMISPCGHRLSITTGVAVSTATGVNATTIYLTPYKNNGILNFNGTNWTMTPQAELSLALDSASGHTGYHQAGKLFDLFYTDDAGTKRLVSGPAWTNDTTRASAISTLNGVYVNTSSMTVRFGSASGNTLTMAASRGTYVGTFMAGAGGSADGALRDEAPFRHLWNMYNRVPRPAVRLEATDSWTMGGGASFRYFNNLSTNRIEMVRGLNEDAVIARAVLGQVNNSTTSARRVSCSIGLDSGTSVGSNDVISRAGHCTDALMATPSADYTGFPGLGYHFLSAMELASASDTQTATGDNGGSGGIQSGIVATIMA